MTDSTERERLVAERNAWMAVGGGNPHTLALAAQARIDALDAAQECRDCGNSFPYDEEADRCPDCTQYERTLEVARTAGAEHGKAAASWYFDGNTSRATYAAVLAGLDDGDPRVLDTFPCAPLSGEWADGPTPASVLADLAGTDAWDGVFTDDEAEELLSAYEDGFYAASADEIERVARLQTAE